MDLPPLPNSHPIPVGHHKAPSWAPLIGIFKWVNMLNFSVLTPNIVKKKKQYNLYKQKVFVVFSEF